MTFRLLFLSLLFNFYGFAQDANTLYAIVDEISASRLESDIKTLVGFGTRHTLSDTLSASRGIGAARRWINQNLIKFQKLVMAV